MHLHHHKKPQAQASTPPDEGVSLSRSSTMTAGSENAAIPPETGQVGVLLVERLRAWKHAVGYLEAYVEATESAQKVMQKEYQKVLKTIEEPLKQGHQFDQSVGGVAAFFEGLRANTVGLSNAHGEAATGFKSAVLPILERLHKEIKDRSKHVQNECERSAKAVAKAQNSTQTQIELLSQHAASFESVGGASPGGHSGGLRLHRTDTSGKPKPDNDPYLLKKSVLVRLNKQIQEENNQQNDLLGVQEHFHHFEAHIIQTIQQALSALNQTVVLRAEKEAMLYSDIYNKGLALPPDFEWSSFTQRYASTLIPRNAPRRQLERITFPNQTHTSTEALMSGELQRKGKIMRSYNSGYYAVTPSKFLHEFKEPDSGLYAKDMEPELSLYLPDCTISALNKEGKFQISGKDAGSSLKGLSKAHDYAFKAANYNEAKKWYDAIGRCAGAQSNESPITSPTSATGTTSPPAYSRHNTQESGIAEVAVGASLPPQSTKSAELQGTEKSGAASGPAEKSA